MDVELLLQKVNKHLSTGEQAQLHTQLTEAINWLIIHDFNSLVQLLYGIDVSEQKLKQLLQNNKDTDAAVIIAKLIMQRQLEKQKLREQFKSTNNDDGVEGKW
ncbi:MAG: hypothetical protein C4329_09120 [Chitinophagaceae bacterium]